MKNSPEITVRISEDLLRKLIYVAESEGRSLNNQILMLSRNSVAYFERAKGKIPAEKLANIDISDYFA
ncbi:MAG: Arc family DNA-binding protein [Ruminococcaceae bacterium]|nr:Arc family DNA-binding protein [Oscillospiraceae bacterium]